MLRHRRHPGPLLGGVAREKADAGLGRGRGLGPAAEDGDGVARLGQVPGQIGAHKARTAGHKHFHANCPRFLNDPEIKARSLNPAADPAPTIGGGRPLRCAARIFSMLSIDNG